MSFSSVFKKAASLFADTLYPENLACAACGRELREAGEFSLCPGCRETLEFHDDFCAKSEEHTFTQSRAACVYAGSARDMVVALKNGNAWVAKTLALIMAGRFPYKNPSDNNNPAANEDSNKNYDNENPPDKANITFDYCMAVPIDKKRLAERGFNQSILIAKELCRLLNNNSTLHTPNSTLYIDGLAKIKHTEKQSLLSGAERAANVKGAYGLSPACPDLSGKTVLLIDDVFTTGATVSECSSAILKGGAAAVYIYAFATGR